MGNNHQMKFMVTAVTATVFVLAGCDRLTSGEDPNEMVLHHALVTRLTGLAAVLKRYPWMDGDEVGALGASFGGYMVDRVAGLKMKCNKRAH